MLVHLTPSPAVKRDLLTLFSGSIRHSGAVLLFTAQHAYSSTADLTRCILRQASHLVWWALFRIKGRLPRPSAPIIADCHSRRFTLKTGVSYTIKPVVWRPRTAKSDSLHAAKLHATFDRSARGRQ